MAKNQWHRTLALLGVVLLLPSSPGTRAAEKEPLILKGHTGLVHGVDWSPDGKHLATTSYDKTVRVWDATSGQETRTFKGLDGWAMHVAWSPDGTKLAGSTGASGGNLKVWNAKTGEEIVDLPRGCLSGFSWSPDGKRIAGGAGDAKIEGKWWMNVLDASTGKKVLEVEHPGFVECVAWSPDGKHLASSAYKSIRIWDAESGKEIRRLEGHTKTIERLSWSPDGKRLASGSFDKSVRIWDPQSGKELSLLQGHTDMVRGGIRWRPDGKRLASVSFDDKTVRIWDADLGKEVLQIPVQATDVAWSPDGRCLAIVGHSVQIKDLAD